jgi:hypothetical protein
VEQRRSRRANSKKKKYKPFERLGQRSVDTEKRQRYGGNLSAPSAVMDWRRRFYDVYKMHLSSIFDSVNGCFYIK